MHDLIVIGAGPGGADLAVEAGKHGLSTVLIEKRAVGGVCLHEGCIPTKSYYAVAEQIKQLKKAHELGIQIDHFALDFAKAKAYKENIVANLHQGLAFSIEKSHVILVEGNARFIDAHTVGVGDAIYQAKHIVIATGSSPIVIPGFEQAMDSTDLLAINEVPQTMTVIGGGIIGIELATIFASFGTKVTIVEMMDTILPFADREIAKRLASFLKSQGIDVLTKAKAVQYDQDIVSVAIKDSIRDIPSEAVLVAVGRKPNVNDLALDNAGVVYSSKGISVNDDFQTNVDHIYAIGDVIGKKMLAHYATYNGYAVLHHILGQKHDIRFDLTPNCVFTFPEIAWVGLTEDELKAKYSHYHMAKGMYRGNGKANAMNEIEGFTKILMVDERIVGVHIIGKDASVLIHEMASLMHKDITKKEFNAYIHAHPTLSEIFSSTLRG